MQNQKKFNMHTTIMLPNMMRFVTNIICSSLHVTGDQRTGIAAQQIVTSFSERLSCSITYGTGKMPRLANSILLWNCHDIHHNIHHDIHHDIRSDIRNEIK